MIFPSQSANAGVLPLLTHGFCSTSIYSGSARSFLAIMDLSSGFVASGLVMVSETNRVRCSENQGTRDENPAHGIAAQLINHCPDGVRRPCQASRTWW